MLLFCASCSSGGVQGGQVLALCRSEVRALRLRRQTGEFLFLRHASSKRSIRITGNQPQTRRRRRLVLICVSLPSSELRSQPWIIVNITSCSSLLALVYFLAACHLLCSPVQYPRVLSVSHLHAHRHTHTHTHKHTKLFLCWTCGRRFSHVSLLLKSDLDSLSCCSSGTRR